jgi:4-alpha-glucanotransferase
LKSLQNLVAIVDYDELKELKKKFLQKKVENFKKIKNTKKAFIFDSTSVRAFLNADK